MTIDALPVLDRTSPTFRALLDALFATNFPNLISQINTTTATIGAIAAGSAQSITYTVSSTTTDADPGPGVLRFDNFAVQTSAAVLRCDLLDAAGATQTAVLDTFDDSSSAVKGYLRLVKLGDASKWLLFSVSAMTAPTGYRDINVVNVAGSAAAPFANGDGVLLQFVRTGDKGDTGAASDALPMFGDGSDGNVTVSSGTTTLTRNMYYNNLTINGTGSIDAAGYQIFVAGTLDLTAAPAGAIKRTPLAGGNATTSSAGAAGAAMAEVMAGGSGQGLIGKSAPANTNAAGTASTRAVKTASMLGGLSGATNAAGSGSNAGGAGAAKPATVQSVIQLAIAAFILSLLSTLAEGGVGGAGGPSGGSSSSSTGGGSGGGGTGGGVLDIRARTITRGAGTAAGALQAKGGDAGDGAAASLGNAGGGSGGAGGGGGFVQLIYKTLTGAPSTGCIDVSGGKGGNGGVKIGTGTDGKGSDGGDGGAFRTFNLVTGAVTHQTSAATGALGALTVGGAGAVQQYDL